MKTASRILLIAVAVLAAGCGSRSARRGKVEMGEAWLAAYIQDQRVGYSVHRFDTYDGGYRFENTIKMTLSMAGKVQKVQSHSTVTTKRDLTLESFDFNLGSQDRSFAVSGVVDRGELKITPSGGGKPRTIKLERPVYPAAALGRLMIDRRLPKDSVDRLSVFDVSVLDVIPTEVQVLGREKVKAGGQEYDALKFKTRMAKFDVTTWVDDKGLPVAENSPPNMRLERTSPKEILASAEEPARLDVLTMFRVPVDTVLPDTADIKRLKLEVSGVDSGEYRLAWDNQKVMTKVPLVVEISTPSLPAKPVKLPVAGQDEFLKPSVSMQCDDARIEAKAKEALGNETDAVAAARKLCSWVFTVVTKEATASFPTALDVLVHMKGDCNEHAVFYGALARAAGIPAKMVVGLVYLNGAFYYHAWDEVYLDKWIPVDPTFGEFPASALHFKLAEGDLGKQAEILGVVGSIKIKVLAWHAAEPGEPNR
jgi:hypothetical protein